MATISNIVTILIVAALSTACTCCQSVPANLESVNAYRAIEASFNRRLQGHFPFCDKFCFADTDAQPADVQAVYQQLQQLQMHGGIEKLPLQQREFLAALDRTRIFLQPLLRRGPDNETLPLKFSIEFAAECKNNPGLEQVTEWSFLSGSEKYTLRNKAETGRWFLSEPVSFTATWANNSKWKPVYTSGVNKVLRVHHLQASFDYTGTWSMIRMLRAHTVSQPLKGRNGYILRFEAPTETKNPVNQQSKSAILSIRIALTGKDGREYLIPTFPATAPALKEHLESE